MAKPIRVGITHGDINGISYEIILKTLADERILELCTPVIFGSSKLMTYFRKNLNLEEIRFSQVRDGEISDGEINLVNISQEEFKVDCGQPTEESGRAAILSLETAVDALRGGMIDILVTAPINKYAVQNDKFQFVGHTEYLQSAIGNEGDHALMVLFDDFVRVALVTTHKSIRELPDSITKDSVLDTIRRFNSTLKRDFAFDCPRIAVLSFNPHNGDNGLLGDEEQTAVIPAIAEAQNDGIVAFGPYAADGFFGSGAYEKFDGVVAMYHDQGLAPFKALAENRGVNFTAGLPFVRTSPDHGTGYDIAGKNVADPTSMREAIYKGIDIYRNRRAFDRASAHPLRKQYVERGADKTVDLTKEEL